MRISHISLLALIGALLSLPARAQVTPQQEPDPCGYPDESSPQAIARALGNWGYGYDSLLTDVARWRSSPFVRVDSVGSTVQLRTLFRLTIEDTVAAAQPRTRVWIHARTHPGEVQGTWVTNQLIAQLLGDAPLARALRSQCVMSILPMLNPDGVELGLARQNANGVDIESNWTAVPGEQEVQALRAQFQLLMAQPNPITIALNMHSALACKRYFVYHAASGTTAAYAEKEQRFIGFVRESFPTGIEPYTYYVSWTSGPSTVYPESWFWFNHGENVLALTYEDMNCASAGSYDVTANAILSGIAKYHGISAGTGDEGGGSAIPAAIALEQNYPNPFNPQTVVSYQLSVVCRADLRVYDLLGREVATLVNEEKPPGTYTVTWNANGLTSGVYFYQLSAGGEVVTKKMVLVR